MLRGVNSRAGRMSTNDPIALRPEGRLLTAVLSRPPDNYIDRAMASSLKELCATLREDSPFDVLIITGEGEGAGAFSRGTDQSFLSESAEASSGSEAQAVFDGYRCASAIASLPFPVIAAINGDAFDQGLELALAADIRVAAETAQFRMGQALQGIIPWDGGTQRLPRIVGPAHATDLLLTGRTIGAGEALDMGLVNRVVASRRRFECCAGDSGSDPCRWADRGAVCEGGHPERLRDDARSGHPAGDRPHDDPPDDEGPRGGDTVVS